MWADDAPRGEKLPMSAEGLARPTYSVPLYETPEPRACNTREPEDAVSAGTMTVTDVQSELTTATSGRRMR